jgi:hypothetical protein
VCSERGCSHCTPHQTNTRLLVACVCPAEGCASTASSRRHTRHVSTTRKPRTRCALTAHAPSCHTRLLSLLERRGLPLMVHHATPRHALTNDASRSPAFLGCSLHAVLSPQPTQHTPHGSYAAPTTHPPACAGVPRLVACGAAAPCLWCVVWRCVAAACVGARTLTPAHCCDGPARTHQARAGRAPRAPVGARLCCSA